MMVCSVSSMAATPLVPTPMPIKTASGMLSSRCCCSTASSSWTARALFPVACRMLAAVEHVRDAFRSEHRGPWRVRKACGASASAGCEASIRVAEECSRRQQFVCLLQQRSCILLLHLIQ